MIRSLIIVVNLLIAFLVRLLSDAPTAEVKAPSTVNAGETFLVEVAIHPNGVTDFMRYSMEFPEGWKAEKVQTAGASFLFEKNSGNEKYSVKFLWSRVGEASRLDISYRVTVPAGFSGDIELPCKLSHTVDNLPSTVQLAPLKLHVNAQAGLKSVAAGQDSTAKPPVPISVIRTVPSGEQTGEFLVDILINKEDLVNFGKLEDSLPEGFSARKVMTDGSDFLFEKGKVKFSWWVMPVKPQLHIQYMVIASPDASGPYTIGGIFSYVENESGKLYTVAPSTVMMKANPATIVENTGNNTQQQATETTGGNAKSGNTGNTGNVAGSGNSGTGNNAQQQQQQQQNTGTGVQNAATASAAGVSFSVQIAAMRRMVPVEYFSTTFHISTPINAEQVEGLNKYTNGSFSTYQEAHDHRETLRGKGVEGPFVTAYNSGKRITVQEALLITSQKWVK